VVAVNQTRGERENSGARRIRRPGAPARFAKARDVELLPLITGLQQQGITSARALAKALNERGNRAPEGGHWQATQVLRLLKRVSRRD
jgi:hypothetical protein